jgi:RimJ/RimL family protein N-acetyltransferase/catechol 2,3-dioxygenase-like lactoylglutathione lyase family enzyme
MASGSRPPLRIKPLRTDRLDLTPLDPAAHAAALHVMLADPVVHQYDTDARASQSVEETALRLHRQVVSNGGAIWAIQPSGGEPIGTIGIFADQDDSVRGVGWSLTRSHWRRGITSEAAKAAIPYLLAQDGVDGLEAWVDSQNLASLGVARAVGMTESGRLPRSYPDRVGQTIVMTIASWPRDREVIGVFPSLRVTDLDATVALLTGLLELHLAWAYPDPPRVAFLAVATWSGSPGFQLEQVAGPVDALQEMSFEVGVVVDDICERVVRAGVAVLEAPHDQPWARREMTFALPEGHRITVSGPTVSRG